jgi:hypothetical protein
MAKMRFYDMDRATIVRVSNNLNALAAGYRSGEKNPRWTPGQQEDLYFLADQVRTMLSIVLHLTDIVQGGRPE